MEKTRCYGCMRLKSPGDVCEHCGYDQRQGNAPHQLPTGTVLKEQYLLGKVLGQGGFGITYLGWDLYLEIPVAVKEYYPTGTVMRETSMSMDVVSCGDEAGARFRNNKERFLREAKMLPDSPRCRRSSRCATSFWRITPPTSSWSMWMALH